MSDNDKFVVYVWLAILTLIVLALILLGADLSEPPLKNGG